MTMGNSDDENGEICLTENKAAYDANRKNCGRKCDALRKGRFLDYVDKRFQENH